jgi:hypothetical protein
MNRADHIKVYCKDQHVWSHGIDCGDGSVIYYEAQSPKSTETVRQVPLPTFARGERIALCDDRDNLKPIEVMRRAQSLLGVKNLRDLRGFVSEDFALWCKRGHTRDADFDSVLDALVLAAHQTARLSVRSTHVRTSENLNAAQCHNPAFVEDVLR